MGADAFNRRTEEERRAQLLCDPWAIPGLELAERLRLRRIDELAGRIARLAGGGNAFWIEAGRIRHDIADLVAICHAEACLRAELVAAMTAKRGEPQPFPGLKGRRKRL